ncbi:MAG: hypothetical protein RL367_1100 [Pseudomonadota bacterium]
MTAFTDQVAQAGFAGRIFNEHQLSEILGQGDARRYGLVNRALKDGSLVRLKRGTYVLGKRYQSQAIHPFAVAQAFMPGSIVSFETALAWHGWIPEAVYTTASVTPGRKTIMHAAPGYGQFAFHPLAIHDYHFMTSISVEKLGKPIAFIAEPLRALMDLVALRKENWSGFDWLTTGMRIDEDQLLSLKRKDFSALKPVYKHRAANDFLHALESAIVTIKAATRGY